MPVAEAKAEVIEALVADAVAAAAEAPADGKDAADKLVADFQALRVALGV